MMRLHFTGSAGKLRGLFALLLLLSGLIRAEGQPYHNCPIHDLGLHAYENPLDGKWLSAYDVKAYHLDLAVSVSNTRIGGSASILVEAKRKLDTLVFELQDALEVSEVRFSDDRENLAYQPENTLHFDHHNDALYIVLDRAREAGELLWVRITYGGEAGQDRGFFAGISTEKDFDYGFEVTYTLSEPHNSKDWFPVKQVLEDKIDSVTFRIRCDKGLLAGSNGLLVDVEEAGDDHIFTWKTGYPMAYYLLSFAVADYRDFSFKAALSNGVDSVLVQNYIYDDDRVISDWEDEIRMTGPLITTFSRLLVDYPFAEEKYGHSMAPMGGGMEHQTMTTLHDFGFFLVAHELAHQWFGDFVTCGNWQDIWINEGFASYFEYVAAQEILGQDAADAWMANAMSIALRETEGSVYVPEEQVNDSYRLFDYGLTYKKGATLLHMIRFILDNDEQFFSILRTYLEGFGNALATSGDFREVLEAESGRDFSCFFNQWYYGEGFPRFSITWEQKGDSLIIRSEQATSAPDVTPLFQVPFELEIQTVKDSPQRIRLMQNSNQEEFCIHAGGFVKDVVFDPENHLLATSAVIEELNSQRPFRYGPNPVLGELVIQFPNADQIKEISVTSMTGQELIRETNVNNPLMMDLSSLADGSYLLELTNMYGTYQEKILKISAD